MRSFTKNQIADLEAARNKIEDSKSAVIEALREAQRIVDVALKDLNEKREEAAELVEELRGKAEDYFNEKSEKWQESETGERYSSWMSAIEEVGITIQDDLSLDLEEIAHEEMDAVEEWMSAIDGIPTELGDY